MTQLPDVLEGIPGDAEAVFDSATRFTTLAETLDGARTTLVSKSTDAVDALDGPRAETFAEASGTVATRLEAVAAQLGIAGLALNDYGTVLASAQVAIGDFATEWTEKQAIVDDEDASTDSVSDARSRQSTLEGDADGARGELTTAANTATTTLDEAAETLVPSAAGMTPEQILEEALGSWASIVLDGRSAADLYADFKQWTDPFLAAQSVVSGTAELSAAASILRNWNAPYAARLLLDQTRTLEDAKIAAALRVTGDAGDYRVLRQFFQAEEVVSKARAGVDAADAATAGRVSRLSNAVMLTSKFAKFTGVLSVISGAYDIINPSHDGWRGLGDRAAGALALGGGGAMLLATAGIITLGTLGAAIAIGALVVAGVWTLGNLVYDHWDTITGAVSDAWDATTDWAGDRWDDFTESKWNPVNWF